MVGKISFAMILYFLKKMIVFFYVSGYKFVEKMTIIFKG